MFCMLFDQLQSDLTVALKSGDTVTRGTLRFLISAVKKYEIDTYLPGASGKLSEDDVVKILRKQVKTHEESIAAFNKGGRTDLVDKETKELAILKKYLPQEMSDEEIRVIVKNVLANGAKDFGPVMGQVMKKVAGRAGGNRVQEMVKIELQKA